MASKLMIVESPAKAKTLSRYLGSEYLIKASMGHVRDLPEKKLSVDVKKDFAPSYEIIERKKKTVSELQKAAEKAETVLLATDPDREGEAIAWHIAHLLEGKTKGQVHRVMFHEITKKAVLEAVANPGEIDLHKVDAQQARRVLDRLVGYLVSSELNKVIARGLSAGRVQSVALRLIVEREEEIEAFVSEEYWIISALARLAHGDPFMVKLVRMGGEEASVTGGEIAEKVIADLQKLPVRLFDLRHRVTKQNPLPPFTTSTLQQEAARRLSMSVRRTMTVAQRLYEGIELGNHGSIGLITYMRTDSTRISPVAIGMARNYIKEAYGEKFLSERPRQYKPKGKRAQDAHEAVRPTSMEWSPDKVRKFLDRDQLRLYELIWNRFLATQMAEAVYEGVTVDIAVGENGAAPAGFEKGAENQPPYLLRALGRKLLFAGFRTLWGEDENGENGKGGKEEQEKPTELPAYLYQQARDEKSEMPGLPKVGDSAEIKNVEGEQKFTQPPPRYTESSLVKMLDELGIGRPSTYAQIISTILDRNYVEREEKRKLKPTELGRTVNGVLVREFEDVFNVKFTATMEEALDKVEEGASWVETVRAFWDPFSKDIEKFKSRRKEIKQDTMASTGRTCPECGKGELVERWGRFGKFISCNRYPECKYIEKVANGEKATPEPTGRACPKCGEGELVKRHGRLGEFIACNRYPKCDYTEDPSLPKIAIPCPREGCGGMITAKKTNRRKVFYGCSNWKEKECKVAFWDQPVEKKCPDCGYPLMTIKGENLVCPECKHKEPYEGEAGAA
ncbi:MAG: type I DNA topoisomerase [bacterium]